MPVAGRGGIGRFAGHRLVQQQEGGVNREALGGGVGRGIGVVDGDLPDVVAYVVGHELDGAFVLGLGGDEHLSLAVVRGAFLDACHGHDVAAVESEFADPGADPEAVSDADLEVVREGLALVPETVDLDDRGIGGGVVAG